MSLTIALLLNGLLAFPGVSAAVPEPLPFVVQAGLPDAAELLSPSQTHIEGWLGARIDANEKNRLLTVHTEPLLAGYRKRPGSHPWIGEHVGKWLHAATLAWAYTGDPAMNETRSSFRFGARTEGEERDQERPSRLTDGRRRPPGIRRMEFDRGSRIAHSRRFGQRSRAASMVARTAVG